MGKPKTAASAPSLHATVRQDCRTAGQKMGLRLEDVRPMKGGDNMEASFRDKKGTQIKLAVRPGATRQGIEQGLRKVLGS